MIDKPPRIALLIDADNSPSAKIGLILNELSTYGETSIRRAYGNWKKQELRGWEELLHEHAIRPMQQFDYSKGKNASDMAMVIDALDLLYSDRPEAFGIVSSDADFTPLVMYLRAKGAAVYGFGGQKTPEPFVNACSRFLYLDKLAVAAAAVDIDTGGLTRDEGAGTPLRVPAAKLKRDAKLVGLLRNAVEAAAGRERLGARRRGRPADRQPGVVRPAQLRLRDAHQAAQGDRAVPARQGGDVRGLGARHPRGPRREGLSAGTKKKRLRRAAFAAMAARRRAAFSASLLSPAGLSSLFFCWALVFSLRASRVVSVPVLFTALSSLGRRHRRPARACRLALSALVVSLRSSRVLSDVFDGAAAGFSPAGATDLAWASALTSARVAEKPRLARKRLARTRRGPRRLRSERVWSSSGNS